MRRSSGTALAALAIAISSAGASAATWEIDPVHSSAQFSVRHLMIANVRGEFDKVRGTVTFDESDLSSLTVEATIDASSIDTGQADRDADLRSANFLDVDRFPTITFRSVRSTPVEPGKLRLVGNLTIHGVTEEVTLDVEGPTPVIEDPWGNVRVGATATTTINRRDFGVTWNKTLEGGGLVVGNDVAITLDLELIREKPPAKGDGSRPGE